MYPRAAQLQDVPAISSLLREVFTDAYGSALDKNILQTHLAQKFSEAAIQETLDNYFLLEDRQVISGVLKITIHAPKVEIEKLYVRQKYVGNGVGSGLIKAALEHAMANNCQILWLNVWKENKAAILFYEKHGFKKVANTKIYVEDIVFNDFVMEKKL